MRCSFCGKEIMKGTGKIFAKKDGTVYFFCSKKCEKNELKLKRNPQKTKWTMAYHKLKEFHAAKEKRLEEKKEKEEKRKKKKKVSEKRIERKKKKKEKKMKKREKMKRRKERKKKKRN